MQRIEIIAKLTREKLGLEADGERARARIAELEAEVERYRRALDNAGQNLLVALKMAAEHWKGAGE